MLDELHAKQMQITLLCIMVNAVLVLASIKLIEGFSWSWWSVTSPLWALMGGWLIVKIIIRSYEITSDSIRETVDRHIEPPA